MERKYELTNETIFFNGLTLYRIWAVKDFADVKAGDLGGWIEKEVNLSQADDAWVYDYAKVYGRARVFDNAKVYGRAMIFDNANVYGNACVCGIAWVYGNARVCGDTWVCGRARVYYGKLDAKKRIK